MKKIIKRAIALRSEALELYKNGVLGVNGSDGIHCTGRLFKEIADMTDSMEIIILDLAESYPIETSVVLHKTRFFQVWEVEQFKKMFPYVPLITGIVTLGDTNGTLENE